MENTIGTTESENTCKMGIAVNPEEENVVITFSEAEEKNKNPKIVKKTKAVIIDLGTRYCKMGHAGDSKPFRVISSIVGKRLQETDDNEKNQKDSFVGQELRTAKVALKYANPLRHGIVVDWDCVQDIWNYIFYKEMKILPEEHAVLVSDSPLNPTTNREMYAEMMFETFHAPAMHIANQSILSMYSYGKISGLVVESGHGVTYVEPIHEGYVLPNNTGRVDYAGSDVTKYLMKLLNISGNKFTKEDLHIVEHIKNTCCYASSELDRDLELPLSEYMVGYELPDGNLITIGKERFLCSEVLFKPSLIGSSQPGLHTLTMTCINKCDATLKHDMTNSILLCGGSTLLDGLPERLQRELKASLHYDKPIVIASPHRKYSVWTGGSILASLKSFQQLWVFKDEYSEWGPSAIHRKCFLAREP
ncbi:actin-like protein 7B [Rhinatrema bivittatum]|uniref:actin-like protein 7B n=1 Tax=Rhinatrema bivittatum TaxID=194408 RepID=UPI00112B7E25|nr:actin-like protein 7B [Rhinatrema bivittatum]